MTYSKLLLSTGGGIISQIQQADQVKNTATLLIGLGGTGVDCLTEIKKAVRERLKPDDPTALVPTYNHIRFLAVDTDLTSAMSDFDRSEQFDIANADVKGALKKQNVVAARRELDWLDTDKINTADIGDAGAGGFRQAGRYMLIDKSNELLEKIKQLIRAAKLNAGNASLYIHLFAGISGGTGSGTFLDTCYLVRKAIEEENGGKGLLFGYFFLPDVNLSKIPDSATGVRAYVPKNGYAAMQELDYCMRLGENQGHFTQTYKGGKQVEWKGAPVDMCHLICSTDMQRQVVDNAYQNAMLVTTEYVMDFLTNPNTGSAADANAIGTTNQQDSVGETKFGIKSHLANFTAQIIAANEKKERGYHLGYCVIGASCASIPMRKINTYLAAKVFESFAVVRHQEPTKSEVQKLAKEAGVADIDRLLMEIRQNAGTDLSPLPDYLDWTYTRDNGDKQMVEWYTNQKQGRIAALETNAKSMMDENNSASLISRLCAQIDACAKDLSRGPAYANGTIMAATSSNLLNVVDGLLEGLKAKIKHIDYNLYGHSGCAWNMYEQARDNWRAEQGKWKRKAMAAYESYDFYLRRLIARQLELESAQKLEEVLNTLRYQLEKKASGYYQKFARVMDNLIATFAENYSTLSGEAEKDNQGLFAIPLVTIDEIKPALDDTVAKLDMSGLMSQFVAGFFDDEDSWRDEDENKIAKKVRDFFVQGAFSSFANRSITAFLEDKYNTKNTQVIASNLFHEFMLPLQSRSRALFPVDSTVWCPSNTSEIAYVSVPATAQVVVNAAQVLFAQDNTFKVKKSALTDRIYVMRCSVALPMCAYANVKLYERDYFRSNQAGRHLYIGRGGSSLANDWSKLPSIIPQSLIVGGSPHILQDILDEARSLYAQATSTGLLKKGALCMIPQDAEEAMKKLTETAEQGMKRAASDPANGVILLNNVKNQLDAFFANLAFAETGYVLPTGSAVPPTIEENIRLDYFVSSPAVQELVRLELAKLSGLRRLSEQVAAELEKLDRAGNALKNY